MKTFEEAIMATLADGALLRENLKSSHQQMMESERWSEEIVRLASAGILNVFGQKDDPAKMLAAMCTMLHIAFDWGKLVGMEMEKP